MTLDTAALPHWDLTPLFSAIDSPEFEAAYHGVLEQLNATIALFDGPYTDATAHYESVTLALEALQEDLRRVRAYLSLRISTNSRDAEAQAKLSALRRELVPYSLLLTRYTRFVGSLESEALIAASPVAADRAYAVREARRDALHLMSPVEEELAANLTLSGGGAWARLHNDLTSQLTVDYNGTATPMAVLRTLATDPDPAVRRRAYEAELEGWKGVALPLSFAMNSIKQESRLLSERRGWPDLLEQCCVGNSITRATLDAMLSAAEKAYPHFRRYLQAKARLVSGQDRLPWWDLFAPVGTESRAWSWTDAENFIETHFGSYSEKLGSFARRTFTERWIDAEPRPGKRDGAFCAGIGKGESRIMQNYRPSFDGVSTLAHELGHAYHNLCLKDRTPFQSGTPMTLAETASIFCETIVKHAALKGASKGEKLAILEASLQGACQVVVDISSRFRFEKAVVERRRERELSADELCAIMVQAQRETYGDGLDDSALHPYMWAVKGHYYGASFYNFPYMFGLLFGLGLYARFEAEPDTFRAAYDDLLSRTGMADAAPLAREFGLDIESEAFWASSLEVIRGEIDQFVALAEEA